MIWRATGVYEIGGRLRLQWRENGRTRYEFMRPGATVPQAIGRRERHINDVAEGRRTPTGTRLTYESLMAGRDTALSARHKKARRYPALDAYFDGWKALTIDTPALRDYVAERQANGAADATIHNELAALRRAFYVALEDSKLTFVPAFPMPEVLNVRESYFTDADLKRLLKLLPAYLRAPVQFAALTGWRAGNVFDLTWEPQPPVCAYPRPEGPWPPRLS
jgi:integrase